MNKLVPKLEKKFNDYLLGEVFKKFYRMSEKQLRAIAEEEDPEAGCVNQIQRFIAHTICASAEAVLKMKFNVDLPKEQSITE